ncbi:hypothetical protein ACPXCB_09230 [Micromonospora sp. DT62]
MQARLAMASIGQPDFGAAERAHRLIDAVARSAATGTRQRFR